MHTLGAAACMPDTTGEPQLKVYHVGLIKVDV